MAPCPVNCPVCGAALVLREADRDADTPEERREAWEAAEAAALLREANGGPR